MLPTPCLVSYFRCAPASAEYEGPTIPYIRALTYPEAKREAILLTDCLRRQHYGAKRGSIKQDGDHHIHVYPPDQRDNPQFVVIFHEEQRI